MVTCDVDSRTGLTHVLFIEEWKRPLWSLPGCESSFMRIEQMRKLQNNGTAAALSLVSVQYYSEAMNNAGR